MGLTAYRKKRDFKTTPEPRGTAGTRLAGNGYLIQKHAARRLHYDLRLEMEGVLKSWAVTRGPSLVPGEKRLAVQVEDHPLEYGSFEGTIPKSEYGGGTVLLWDRGRWSPIGDAKKGYAKGRIDFEIKGEKLGGRWHLVRMAKKPREKKENWLLIKGEDEFARGAGDPDIIEERPESVKTGRTLEEIAGEAPGWSSKTGRIEKPQAEPPRLPKKAKKAAYPGFVEPALATLRKSAPKGTKWLHEIKFDGYRLQVHIRKGKICLLTRSGLDWTDRFGGRITSALAQLTKAEAIIDGEVVVEGPAGATDFSTLQADLGAGRTDRLAFYAFDLLYFDGHDLRPSPQIERKVTLASLLKAAPDVLRYSEHFEEQGEIVLRHACRLSLEGIVSKSRDAPYRSGRGKEWIKSKCAARQEFVIAGFVPSTTANRAIGSLILGYYDSGKLTYAGRVGTGYSLDAAQDLFRRLDTLRQPKSPFARSLSADEARQAKFVRPELVAEIEFSRWTVDGVIRHASFRGLREDKKARDVVFSAPPSAGSSTTSGKAAPAVKLTHPDRLYWKDAGVTKAGLADYYCEIWPLIAPFVVNRPLALVRCPDGVGGQCFFQKHAWRGQSKEILKADDPEDEQPLIAIDDLPGLLGLVQGGALEIHPWGSQLSDLDRPDLITIDLDPGPNVEWGEVIEAALEARERLNAAGLESFVKTSGGKGLHVVAPLEPEAGWDDVKAFAKSIADGMASDSRERYVATTTKSKRVGRIFVDYLRNARGSTTVAPYSTRARSGAAVSLPLAWEELSLAIGPSYFTVENTLSRLAGLDHHPWEEFPKAAVPLRRASRKAA
ncbi:DNA ligase D [Chelativorans alearense]|uniref:DNA ligase D n=1 Tax=Chelativorans alearense TaxID=2681495 RepID=UPI0013D78EC0|nr:DNA ligase D [Chelativorans alearense]